MRLRTLMGKSLLLGLVALAGCAKSQPAATSAEAAAARPISVSVAPAVRRDVPIYLDGLGSVAAWKTVTVRAQVDGRLDKVRFREGQQVRRGEVLAEIDPRPFLAQLHQAEGALARDSAMLRNNRLNLERYTNLRKQDLIAQQQADDQQAAVDQYAGAVSVDQAQIENARLQLGYAQITSPIDGVTGVRLIDEGNLVHAGDPGGLVVVTQLDPIAVLFTLPEDDLPRLLPRQKQGPVTIEAYNREGDVHLGTGELVVIDNQINQSTATVRLKAAFPNPEHKLWPNQFVKARLLLETRKSAIVIPAVAVQRGPKGTFVYTVSADQTAAQQPVELAEITGPEAIITKGLGEGASVITEGQNQLRPGAPVAVARSGRSSGDRPGGGQGAGPPGGKTHGGSDSAGARTRGSEPSGARDARGDSPVAAKDARGDSPAAPTKDARGGSAAPGAVDAHHGPEPVAPKDTAAGATGQRPPGATGRP